MPAERAFMGADMWVQRFSAVPSCWSTGVSGPCGPTRIFPDGISLFGGLFQVVMKRHLSPVYLPPPKRQHGVYPPPARAIISSFDNALYDELVLFIFSFLNSSDLCAVQAANKNCSRLACDTQVLAYTLRETDVEHQRHRHQLWKTLYVRDFGKARLRGGNGFYTRKDGRLVKRLPSRASLAADNAESLNWKWMYRISSNWRNGGHYRANSPTLAISSTQQRSLRSS